ncbi:hypothetical protein C0431_02640 [bacterium]|jgi:hypothetical protein|nr:hypothetical protein [bacterium]
MKKALLALPILALISLLVSGYLFAPKDQDLITAALRDSTAAAAKGEPSDVLRYLSKSFTYGGEATSTYDISKVIHNAKPKITIIETKANIQGENATVQTPVDVQLNYMGLDINQTIPKVTIELKKETGFKWLFVPEPRWRVVSVSAESLPNY